MQTPIIPVVAVPARIAVLSTALLTASKLTVVPIDPSFNHIVPRGPLTPCPKRPDANRTVEESTKILFFIIILLIGQLDRICLCHSNGYGHVAGTITIVRCRFNLIASAVDKRT